MIQATITAAQAGSQDAVEQVLLEASMLAKDIARKLVPRYNRHHWFDYEDVAQLATELFWQTMLATVTEERFATAVYLTVRTANFKMNRRAMAARRSAGPAMSLIEDTIAATANHVEAVDDSDAIDFLREHFPSCQEAIAKRLTSEPLNKIEAGRWKRMKYRVQELNMAECCV
jgi:hypothetical protein